ncbi:23S rRNA (guanosine(2251)-2'-O)-methyltransferase RlmB [Aquimarina sp. ERC-38]|uniref:23S rRNA (guanosine(2251)-2'-O)-methyltransferase RlmB n=1 Tax=Aquimarina sp. ERC-38 TaxID=2949996 RepID=UPI0022467C4C|nr:23S rRNA (guanosine(2251)-2'-O)-methyltransferase RlmB [Aquimarina sp. ERC-38]UZO80960.1 23S rRNA (guanosine(2251)-2'-O)-methyltransferase RlmB [Aquimarina sp. ERC-38]
MKKHLQIYGRRAIMEAVQAGKPLEKVFIQKGLQGELAKELLSLFKKEGIHTSMVPIEKLNRLTDGNHQGVVANISPITFAEFEPLVDTVIAEKEKPVFLILDQLSDVRNFGAIIRTASCTGVDAIIVQKKGGAPVNEDTIKTSAGAVFQIPICKVDHIKDAVFYLQGSGVQVVAATEKASSSLYEAKLDTALAIVMGSEGRGINPSVLKITDHNLKLHMMGEIGSLNVSVACGVFLYEVVRQRFTNSEL